MKSISDLYHELRQCCANHNDVRDGQKALILLNAARAMEVGVIPPAEYTTPGSNALVEEINGNIKGLNYVEWSNMIKVLRWGAHDFVEDKDSYKNALYAVEWSLREIDEDYQALHVVRC